MELFANISQALKTLPGIQVFNMFVKINSSVKVTGDLLPEPEGTLSPPLFGYPCDSGTVDHCIALELLPSFPFLSTSLATPPTCVQISLALKE